jgi:phage/plasmid-like protein (TIGR03299 family)
MQNMEKMFNSRQPVWGEIGKKVSYARSSADVLRQGGLDWRVVQQPIYANGKVVPNQKLNVCESSGEVLGIVGSRYQIIQNSEAFSFLDVLLDEGVTVERVGSIQNGKRCFVVAKLPDRYILNDERIDPYICFCNSHDGSLAMTIFMMPVRILCMNTLNIALKNSKRSFSIRHTGNTQNKLHEAHEALNLAHNYMSALCKEITALNRVKISDEKVSAYISELVPLPAGASELTKRNLNQIREDIHARYYNAPDLKNLPKNGYRLFNAVSDHATHSVPLRKTENFAENLFMKTLDGHPMIDRVYALRAYIT